MSPKKKTAAFQPVRVSPELLEETRKCAELADEYVADYIRKAVETRNAQYKQPVSKPEPKTCGNCSHLDANTMVCMVKNRECGYDKECIDWKPKEQQVKSPKGGGKK